MGISRSTLASHIVRQSSSRASAIGSSPWAPPALLSSRWTRATRAASAVTLAASATSRISATASAAPAALISRARSRSRSSRRAPRTTWKPAAASARALAAPIPELAPVTTAIFASCKASVMATLQSTGAPGSSLRGRAEVGDDAARAQRPAGLADLAAMGDQQVGPEGPVALRHEGHQVALDLLGIAFRGQPQAARQPLHVGVDDHSHVLAEGIAQHHVGGLAADARQAPQLFHGRGHLPAMLGHERLSEAEQGARLVVVEAGRAHQ